MLGLSLETSTPNLKSVALTILEKLSTGLIDRETDCTDGRTDGHTLKENSISAIHPIH